MWTSGRPLVRAGWAILLVACSNREGPPEATSDAAPPWGTAPAAPPPRPGMVWIPAGKLLAGTPKDQVPRVPDAEMAGEPIEMSGFFIDRYPYPNEPGAIPSTHMSWEEAKALCEKDEKRLCTELELERACKGPANTTYPYGNSYRPDVCKEAGRGTVSPIGINTGCKSAFGVQDTHGTVWFWTASSWERKTEGLVAIRGGRSASGELVGRCANGEPEDPSAKREDLGVRCCAGPMNAARVVLDVERGPPLKLLTNDEVMIQRLEDLARTLPSIDESVAKDGGTAGTHASATFDAERAWAWRPAGNERLFLGGGCAPLESGKWCGVIVAREAPGSVLVPLSFVATEEWQPTLGETERSESVFIHGGDRNGAFRKRVTYEWGRIGIGEKQRKKKRKGRKPRYE